MVADFNNTTIGDQVTLQRGFDITRKEQQLGPIPVISSGGISSFHNSAMVKGPGVVLGRKGTLGTVFFIEPDFWPHDTTLWVKDFKGNDPRFVYYFFKHMSGELKRMDVGAANPALNRNHVHPLPATWPCLRIQKSISELLGRLDDKIALNHKTNTILESMAQALFKSWFVDFNPVIDNALTAGNPIPDELKTRAEARAALGDQRKPLPDHIRQQFPDRFVMSNDLGWVPEGWEISTIGEEVATAGGGTPSTKEPDFWEGGENPFCTPKDMSQLQSLVLMDTERHLTGTGVGKISSGQLAKGTVLMSSRAPIGYLAISDIPVSINQGIIAMLPNPKYGPIYLLCWAQTNMIRITDRANGSTFQEISKKNFRPIPFLVPEKAMLDYFNRQAKAIYSRILLTSEQTENLSKLRDTLLPKLLSGELRVPEAEQQIEEAT